MAHPEKQVDGPLPRIAAHESRQRPDARAGADQDQRRPAPTGAETGVAAQEGGHRVARLQRRELARAEAAGMLLHDDLDEPVAACRRPANRAAGRALPSGRTPIRSPAVEPGEARPGQPLPERGARQGEAQDRGRGLHLGAVVPARDEGQRLGLRQDGLVRQLQVDLPAPLRARDPSARSPAATGGRPCRGAGARASPSPRPPRRRPWRRRSRPESCGRRSRARPAGCQARDPAALSRSRNPLAEAGAAPSP